MTWKIEISEAAKKQLKKLDRQWQRTILDYLEDLSTLRDPKTRGKQLTGTLKNFWRYRVGDYRILCDMNDHTLTILALVIAHRKSAYD